MTGLGATAGVVGEAAPYVVVSGDTLSRIAGRAYGEPMLFGPIVEANADVLRGHPEALQVGMSLQIPCLDADGQPPTAEAAASMEAVVGGEGPLTPAELDTLFGPVALFPDQVLTPVLVAVTFPLDVVKTGRFVAQSTDLTAGERSAQALAQPWDDSVQQLVAGFPDVVNRMSDHIEWTEQAGEAVVAQTDDVLAAIQRLRARAQETGYLADGPTQTVETVNNTITITPTEPNVVYVPTCDSQVVYTTPVSAPPYCYDDGNDWGEALAAGAIILGEIFDDDEWGGWDGDDIDWDRGDINIDRGDREINSLDGQDCDPEPFEGDYFRILQGQGPAAPGGACSYMISGNMVAGHAVIAHPAVYGDTGIMSFMVAENGIVLEADLGAGTLAKAHEISIFDPGQEWLPVE